MEQSTKHERFLKLFMSNRYDIHAFIVSVVRDAAASEDLFQEVSIILWNKFDTYDEGKSFKAWARGIAGNKILQYWQKQKKNAEVFSPKFMDEVLAAYNRTDTNVNEMIDALKNCKQELPEKQSEILKYKYENKYKLDQIAEKLGKSLASTQKALSRLRFALKDCIKRRIHGA